MTAKRVSLLLLVLLSLALVLPILVRAMPAEYQRCIQGQSCTIGEFLYDDNYVPITTASCTITSRDPGGTMFINAATLTPNSDGWYSYSVNTVGATLGIYRTQVCCTADTDYLCIDKTFTINDSTNLTAQDVEDAVLDASLADHTDTGSVGDKLNEVSTLTASEIWNYTSRSLTSFGSLVTNIWGHDERTLTEDINIDTSNLATKDDINNLETDINTVINNQTTTIQTTVGGDNTGELQEIQNQIAENRTILEALLNDPIISSSGDSYNDSTLQTMLDLAADYLNQIYANTQSIISRIGLLVLNWDTFTAQEIADELEDILATLGNNPSSDSYNTSVINQLSWFDETWSNSTTNNAYSTTNEALTQLNQVLSQVDINNKTADTKTTLQNALTSLNSTETYIGNLSSESTSTLFGLLKKYLEMAKTLAASDQQLSNLLSNWNSYNTEDLQTQVASIESDILSLNLIPKSDEILATTGSNPNEQLRNKAIALKALINLNQKLLSNTGNAPIQTIWLETNGDLVVFRSAIFNPSASESKSHTLKYYLPKELSLDDVLTLTGSIDKEYDTAEEKSFIEGSFNLSPRQVLLQSTETKNFWHIPEAELDGIKDQAAELLSSLEGTSYYGQGTQLKGDIDVTLALIKERQNQAATPEDRIMTFRQSLLELEDVRENMAKLNDLVTQANSTGTLMGFIGGIQAVSIWGIVIIIIAGVVGITLYMRYLHREEMAVHGVPVNDRPVGINKPLHKISPVIPFIHQTDARKKRTIKRRKKPDSHQKIFHVAIIGLTSATLAAMAAGSIVDAKSSNQETTTVTDSTANNTPLPTEKGSGEIENNTTPKEQATPLPDTHAQAKPTDKNITILGESSNLQEDQGQALVTQGPGPVASPLTLSIPPGERYNLRAKPSSQAKVIEKLTGTYEIEIIEDTGEWVNIKIDEPDLSGWLHHDLLNL